MHSRHARAAARSPGASRDASMKPLPPSARRISTSPCSVTSPSALHRTECGNVSGRQIARRAPHHGATARCRRFPASRSGSSARSPDATAGGGGGGLTTAAGGAKGRIVGPCGCGRGQPNCITAMTAARQNVPPSPAHNATGRSDSRGPRGTGSILGRHGRLGSTGGAIVGGTASGIAQHVVGEP